MLYLNTKAMVHSPDGNTEYFHIIVGVLQGDKSVSYMLIVCLDYVLWTSIDLIKENGFIKKNKKNKQIISCRNFNRHKLCRWSSTSCKYTCPSWIPTV